MFKMDAVNIPTAHLSDGDLVTIGQFDTISHMSVPHSATNKTSSFAKAPSPARTAALARAFSEPPTWTSGRMPASVYDLPRSTSAYMRDYSPMQTSAFARSSPSTFSRPPTSSSFARPMTSSSFGRPPLFSTSSRSDAYSSRSDGYRRDFTSGMPDYYRRPYPTSGRMSLNDYDDF